MWLQIGLDVWNVEPAGLLVQQKRYTGNTRVEVLELFIVMDNLSWVGKL